MSSLIVLPTVAFVLLLLAALLQAAFLLRRARKPAPVRTGPSSRPVTEQPGDGPGLDPLSPFLLPAAALLLLADLVRRSIEIRFVAVTGLFESLVFFAGVVALTLFAYRRQTRERCQPFVLFGGTATALLLLALASSPWLPARWCHPSPPCSRTGWCCTSPSPSSGRPSS